MKPTTIHYNNYSDSALFDALQQKMASLGFDQWIYSSAITLHKSDNMAVNRISSYPEKFIDDYNGHCFSDVDPSTPYWLSCDQAASYRKIRRTVTLSARQKSLMSLNADHQVNKGIVIPLRNVLGFKAVLALSFDGTIAELNSYIDEVQAELLSTSLAFNRQCLFSQSAYFINTDKPTLTQQQTKILTFIAQGLLTKQIADILSISANGIDKHIANIKHALSAKTTAEAVTYALQWGLI